MKKLARYSVDWFIDFFAAIPAKKWCVRTRTDTQGRHCAVGFFVPNMETVSEKAEEGENRLRQLFDFPDEVIEINNSPSKEFPQRTPRARILAALREIKKRQEAAK